MTGLLLHFKIVKMVLFLQKLLNGLLLRGHEDDERFTTASCPPADVG